jgi:hypothetical protein
MDAAFTGAFQGVNTMTDQAAETQDTSSAPKATILDLENVFEDAVDEAEADAQVTEQEESKSAKAKAEQPKGDAETEADDEEAQEEGDEAATPAEEDESWTKAMALDERRKRQAAENEAKLLKEKLAKYESGQSGDDEGEGDAEDGEAKKLSPEQIELRTKITVSRDIMLDTHPDYEKAEEIFLKMATPDLVKKMNASVNPAKFVYDTAKATPQFQEYQEFLKWKAGREEQNDPSKAKKSKSEQRKASAVKVPDLTKAAAAGSNSEPVEKVEDLNDMFKDSKF